MAKIKRPLALKLIIIFIVLELILGIYFASTQNLSGIGIGTILIILGLYYGLWKMRRDWMYLTIFILGITTLYLIFTTIYFNAYNVLDVILYIISIYWLYSHRNLFTVQKRKKHEKFDWKKFGIYSAIGFGIIFVLFLLLSYL